MVNVIIGYSEIYYIALNGYSIMFFAYKRNDNKKQQQRHFGTYYGYHGTFL